MPDLPARFAGPILAFAPLFVHRSWRHASVLLSGAIATPRQRTVASVLRIIGRARERRFLNVHRILNRAAWCPSTGSRILLGLLIAAFAPRGPVVPGLDDTIERRRGKRIAAKGIYRDPVRSSDSHFVKASGLRWMWDCPFVILRANRASFGRMVGVLGSGRSKRRDSGGRRCPSILRWTPACRPRPPPSPTPPSRAATPISACATPSDRVDRYARPPANAAGSAGIR